MALHVGSAVYSWGLTEIVLPVPGVYEPGALLKPALEPLVRVRWIFKFLPRDGVWHWPYMEPSPRHVLRKRSNLINFSFSPNHFH